MNIVVSCTEQLKFGYHFKSIHSVCFIKAIFPLLNYDDEPSVSKGIVSQLPSSHLSIHRVPAKLLDGVVPHGKNRCRLQLLFLCLIVTDLHLPVVVLIYSVDAIPSQVLVGLLQMQSVPDSIIYGFLFQNPVQSPMPFISHSTEFWICFFYLLCCHWCL